MPNKILVTGGAGFLGSHLCDRLIRLGHHVLCADNLSTGAKQNIAQLVKHPGFEFIDHDITRPLKATVDQIYNLACPASPRIYQTDPLKTTKTAVIGAVNMLDLATKHECPILQASTSEIYGDPEVHPQPETYQGRVNPIGPRACYDEGKRCAESLFFDYHRQHGVEIKVARIFNTYGPKMMPGDGRVISNFISQALNQIPLTISGNGLQTRSFCYVDDMVDGLISLMNTPSHVTGPVNLGNPVEVSILDLAQKIIRLTKSTSQTIFSRLPVDDPQKRQPEITLAIQMLGWNPATPLQQGLEKTIQWFRTIQS